MLKTVGNPSTRYGDQTIVDGNLVIGTAGKGIDFSADPSAAGMTSELFDDYEEGTWTPTFTSWDAAPTETIANKYTKVGRLVTLNTIMRGGTIGSGDSIGGLPFTPVAQGASAMITTLNGTPLSIGGGVDDATASIQNLEAATFGTRYWSMSVSYIV
jgi:hypothetical protein